MNIFGPHMCFARVKKIQKSSPKQISSSQILRSG